MKVYKAKDYFKGWLIGDFEPSLYKTNLFEIAYKHHGAGENYERHAQKKATEWTLVVDGKMSINGVELRQGDIIEIPPLEFAKPDFHTDCEVIVIKVPSLPKDKVIDE